MGQTNIYICMYKYIIYNRDEENIFGKNLFELEKNFQILRGKLHLVNFLINKE